MWVLKIGRVIVKETAQEFPYTSVCLAILVYLSFDRTGDQDVREGLWKRNLKSRKKKK